MADSDPFEDEPRPGRLRAFGRAAPLVALAALVAAYAIATDADDRPPADRRRGIGEASPLPPPDDDPAFRAVRDREPIRFREVAAYRALLDRVRETPPDELRERARDDVYFSDLLRDPARYRGLPIRLQGTARRVLRLEDIPESLAPGGELFEAWTFTSDSRGYPYVLVFEDPPEGLPGGDDVDAFVIFRGYFFKLLAYAAADTPRVAPMLVGRVEYVPDADGPAPAAPGGSGKVWLLAGIAAVVLYLFYRSAAAVRSALGAGAARRRIGPRPREEISPEELDHWLREGGGDGDPSGR